MSISTTLGVNGLTCDHCVRAVTDELKAIQGVKDVEVTLVNGGTSKVVITSETVLTDDDVTEAVTEAGYVIARPGSLV